MVNKNENWLVVSNDESTIKFEDLSEISMPLQKNGKQIFKPFLYNI